jgi:hypothetical protein
MPFPFLSASPVGVRNFFLYFDQTPHHDRLKAETELGTQLFALNPGIKEFGKSVRQCHSSHYMLFWKIELVLFIIKNVLLI